MKWGNIKNSGTVDYTLPDDPIDNKEILGGIPATDFKFYLGYANLSKVKLKGFYPGTVKDELVYYSKHFNAIEFNATFYKEFLKNQYAIWKDKTPSHFKFFPKVLRIISHQHKLHPCTQNLVTSYLEGVQEFKENLGIPFLQLPSSFRPSNGFYLNQFLKNWPDTTGLAIEFRHLDWYSKAIKPRLFHLLQVNNISHIITDTPGRRDLLHVRLTNKVAFIRFLAADLPLDEQRLDNWLDRLAIWKSYGLEKVCFFIHQDVQKHKPFLATTLVPKINEKFNLRLPIPQHTYHSSNLFS